MIKESFIMHSHSTSSCPICNGPGKHDFSSKDLMFNGNICFDYHRCVECGLIFQHPLPSEAEIARFYPDNYAIYTNPDRPRFSRRELLTLRNKSGYRHLKIPPAQNLLKQMALPKPVPYVTPYVEGGKVLDIGCGNGEYLLRLQSIGWQCQGVEFNPKAVEICRAHGLDVHQGDLEEAHLDDESFDLVTAHHLIEHVPDPHRLMEEIARITKPGGTVLIRTPNSASLGRGWFGAYWFANEVPRHLMLYSEHNLTMLASRHGLRLTSVCTPVKPKLILRSLDYRLKNRGKPFEKRKLRRQLAKFYIPMAKLSRRGDELFALFSKP